MRHSHFPEKFNLRHVPYIGRAAVKGLIKISLSLGKYGTIIQGSTFFSIFNNIKTLSDIHLSFGNFFVTNQGANDFLVEGLRELDAPSVQKLRLHVHKNPTPELFLRL